VNILMENIKQVDEILKDLNSHPKVITSLVILKNGMHIAGQPPTGVDLETFVAMASILLSAAESAISGLKGNLENVFVELDRSRIIIESAGEKGALVVLTNTKDNHDTLCAQIKKVAQGIAAEL
jgi:predicted regulator of Ras-like GTPase activity (Roadblock/LC7/MglB family)